MPDEPAKSAYYRFAYAPSGLRHDQTGDFLSLSGLSFTLGLPGLSGPPDSPGPSRSQSQGLGFNTSLELRLGQMTVVGKSNFEAGNNSLITVLSARIVN